MVLKKDPPSPKFPYSFPSFSSGAEQKDGESLLIKDCFLPLTQRAPEALGLTDDTALFSSPHNQSLVITKDSVVENIHFRSDDPLPTIARKALRVNLSDLAAKGARPLGYFLSLIWPDNRPLDGIKDLAEGLALDQDQYNLTLWGGDTVRSSGPLSLSITALGSVPQQGFIPRSAAQQGDQLFMTGSLGDSGLGLKLLSGEKLTSQEGKPLSRSEEDWLIQRYRLPEPRLGFLEATRPLVHAAMDISDGLFLDAFRLAKASGLSVHLDLHAVPLSGPASVWAGESPERFKMLASCGDDYELLIAAPPDSALPLRQAAHEFDLNLKPVGSVLKGEGICVVDHRGKSVFPEKMGYEHVSF